MKAVGYLALDLADSERLSLRPKGAWKRWLNKLTGAFEADVEAQVLPMATLLSALYQALAEQRHDNLIRLAIDAETAFDDSEGSAGDLEAALDAADPGKLANADRLQLVVEEEDDLPIYVVINALVYRRHDPGAFPIWLRATALDKELLRRPNEKPKPYKKRIRDRFDNAGKLQHACEDTAAALQRLLDELGKQLRKRLPVADLRVEAHADLSPGPDDYYLSLRPEYWDAAELLHTEAASTTLPDVLASPPRSIKDFVAEQAGAIQKLEATLRPPGEQRAKQASEAEQEEAKRSWTAYSQRRVINPRTGRICQIRSLPPELQHRYREIYNAGAPSEQAVETSGYVSRMLGRVQRGLTGGVGDRVERLADSAPSTYAFLKNKRYRRKVFGHSAKLLGQEMIDGADAMATTIVREAIETGRIPLAWWKGNKVYLSQKDHEEVEAATDQMLDIGEFVVGTLVPVGAFAIGGPLGGVAGLAGIKIFQKALNWHSKRTGGREWTIMPSAWHARRQEQAEARKDDRAQDQAALDAEASRVVRQAGQLDLERVKAVERQLAENFRDFGRRVVAGEVEVDDEMLDVSTLKSMDIEAAMANEATARKQSGS